MIKGKTRVVLLVTAGLFSVIAWADLRIGTSLNRFAWVTKKETVSIQPDRTDAVVMAQAEEKIKEVRSGDGKARLIRVVKEATGGEVNYSLKVISGGTERELFSKVVGPGASVDIPLNSWSPDNKQFFLQENDGQAMHYLVYREDGGKYRDGQEYLNINEDWLKSKNNYTIKEVTGWEGNDLLRVNTSNADGSRGPSFWFVISTRKFLQLRG